MKITSLLIAIILFVGSIGASAQTMDCPEGLECIEHQDSVIQVDPDCGPIQAIVTEETRVRTMDGDSFTVSGVVLVRTEDSYEVVSYFTEPARGDMASVRFGEVGCIEWQGVIQDE